MLAPGTSNFYLPTRLSCYCKSTNIGQVPTEGIVSGLVDCDAEPTTPYSQSLAGCYDYDTDLTGPDLINGLDNKQDSDVACQTFCQGFSGKK